MRGRTWMFVPDRGGVKIPDRIKRGIETKIRELAERRFKGNYTRLGFRFRGALLYIDAYTEPVLPTRLPKGWPETRAEYAERLRNTPMPLCRLRHYSEDRWCYALFVYSSEKYETSVFPSGEFMGRAEDAFEVAAGFHLASP